MSVLEKARVAFERVISAEAGMTSDESGLDSTQAALATWQGTRFGAPPIEQMTLGVSEELGELAEAFGGMTWSVGRLAHAVLKHRQRTRGGGDIEVLRARAVDALGDMMVFAASVATILRVDLLTVYRGTAEEVMARGGDALPAATSSLGSNPTVRLQHGSSNLD